MSKTTPWSSLTIAVAGALLIAAGAVAQSEPSEEPTLVPVALPELDGLAWYPSIDLSGAEIQATLDDREVAEWSVLAERADATLDELEYTYQLAFDPAALPDLGAMATVRVAGADTDALRTAVVEDIINQMVGLGNDAPEPREDTIAGKDVTIVGLPDDLGLQDAIVYAAGDVAYVFLLAEELAEQALEQLP